MATTTLRQLNGFDETPATFEDAVLVLVDYQNTYTGGVMELDGWEPALASASRLLARAREAGTPVVHVRDGGYGVDTEPGTLHASVAPRAGEAVVTKSVPNGFRRTDLHEIIEATGRKNLIIAGFMTNMCTLFTTEGAFLHGYAPTVVADASATRALESPAGALTARQIHQAALATVTELYGVVVATGAELK